MSRILSAATLLLAAFALSPLAWAPDFGIILDGPPDEVDRSGSDVPVSYCQPYKVTIKTADVANGGTDGSVYITINKNGSSTGAINLGETSWQATKSRSGAISHDCKGTAWVKPDSANPSDNFERGSTETYTVWAEGFGSDITSVDVRMDAEGTAAADWMLQSIEVFGSVWAGNNKWAHDITPFRANYNDWLASGVSVSLSEDADWTDTFTLVFRTGTDSGAGTDSEITVRLDGVDGAGQAQSFERVINPFLSGNAFENGSVDTATIEGVTNMRRITSLTITSADNYAGSAWQLSSVEISASGLCGGAAGARCTDGTPETFDFGNVWLGGDRLSASARSTSIDRPDFRAGVGEREADFCRRVAQRDRYPADVADIICPGTTDANRDLLCVGVALINGMPAQEWARKCLADAEAAQRELRAQIEGRNAAPPAPPAPEARPEPPNPPEAQPAPEERPAPPAGVSEEARCMGMIDGRVAWDQAGSTAWDPDNIAALCAGAADADARIACFQGRIAAGEGWESAIPACAADDGAAPVRGRSTGGSSSEADHCKALLQDQVPWQIDPPERHWFEEDLDALCDGTTNAAATVRCFQDRLWNNGNQTDIQTAIAACRED